jgi:hypothetical protein
VLSSHAVAKGALYRAADEDLVRSYISRRCVGFTLDDPYKKGSKYHEGAHHVPDELDGRDYVKDCVHTLLHTVRILHNVAI